MEKIRMWVLILFFLTNGAINLSFAVDLKGSTFSHDPATLIKDGDTYWHFFTAPGIGAAYSKDRVTWYSSNNHIFKTGSNWKNNYPAWTIPYFGSGEGANTDGNLWAPDVIFMNGAYYLYYSCSSFGSTASAIGCVKSNSLNNPKWVDMGMVVSSKTKADFNAIDPGMFRDDDGKVYMVYGSFSAGIAIVDIDTITGLATSTPKYLAGESGRSYEGAALFKEGAFYYLVINRGSCCNGINSTYFIIIGRSANVKGPYQEFRTLLPNKDGKYIGPGHFSLYRDKCANYVTTHYYDGTANGFARYDILKMEMAEGWPVLTRNFTFSTCNDTKATDNTLPDSGLAVYPNPVSRILKLNLFHKPDSGATLSIRNAEGREVLKTLIDKEEVNLDVTALKNGIYCLVVSDGKFLASTKFIKVK